MKLSQIRAVVASAEYGSLRAAARHLGTAQPVITRNIRDLEHELGVVLFERHVKGARLTHAGKVFVRRATAFQAEVRRMQEEMEQLKGRSVGEVTLGLSTASIMMMIPAILRNFRKRFPEAVLKVSESLYPPIESQIIDGQMDLYVGPVAAGAVAPEVIVEQMFDNRRYVAGRRGHPLAGARSLAELAGADWIRPALSQRTTEGDFVTAFGELGLPDARIVLHSQSALTTLTAITHSDLLTVLPRQWLTFGPFADQIIGFEHIAPLGAPPTCIVSRRDLPLTPMAEYLSDVVRRAGLNAATPPPRL